MKAKTLLALIPHYYLASAFAGSSHTCLIEGASPPPRAHDDLRGKAETARY